MISRFNSIKKDRVPLMKEFIEYCNWTIKYGMLKKYKNSDFLIDLGTGRGNDINRWIQLKFKRVIGIDNDREQIRLAIERIKKKKSRTNVSYICESVCNPELINYIPRSDKVTITCNFALNHFIFDEKFFIGLKNIVESFDDVVFIGTAMDGDALIQDSITEYYVISIIDDKSYSFYMKDSEYFKDKGPSIEYVVKREYLIEKMDMCGLIPIDLFNFSEYKYEHEHEHACELSEGVKQLCKLYIGFVFKKKI